uniref:Uncharacterized protein n=1 Tax=Schistocephalus solidus TaxID=70667 RepID=A0A0X3P2H9_SCHSO
MLLERIGPRDNARQLQNCETVYCHSRRIKPKLGPNYSFENSVLRKFWRKAARQVAFARCWCKFIMGQTFSPKWYCLKKTILTTSTTMKVGKMIITRRLLGAKIRINFKST